MVSLTEGLFLYHDWEMVMLECIQYILFTTYESLPIDLKTLDDVVLISQTVPPDKRSKIRNDTKTFYETMDKALLTSLWYFREVWSWQSLNRPDGYIHHQHHPYYNRWHRTQDFLDSVQQFIQRQENIPKDHFLEKLFLVLKNRPSALKQCRWCVQASQLMDILSKELVGKEIEPQYTERWTTASTIRTILWEHQRFPEDYGSIRVEDLPWNVMYRLKEEMVTIFRHLVYFFKTTSKDQEKLLNTIMPLVTEWESLHEVTYDNDFLTEVQGLSQRMSEQVHRTFKFCDLRGKEWNILELVYSILVCREMLRDQRWYRVENNDMDKAALLEWNLALNVLLRGEYEVLTDVWKNRRSTKVKIRREKGQEESLSARDSIALLETHPALRSEFLEEKNKSHQ